MRFKPKRDSTSSRTLTSLRPVDAGAHIAWVSAAKILRTKRRVGAKDKPSQFPEQNTFVKKLAQEFMDHEGH